MIPNKAYEITILVTAKKDVVVNAITWDAASAQIDYLIENDKIDLIEDLELIDYDVTSIEEKCP